MAKRVTATKANLLKVKSALEFARKGYGLLDKKRAVLMREMMRLNDRAQTSHIQLVCGLSSICWTIFNLAIFSYMGVLFNLINAAVYFYNFRKNHKDLKLEENKLI